MSWNHRNLRQTITYWAPAAADGFGGRSFSSPTTIKGRWEGRVNLITDSAGREKVSNAIVYLSSQVVVNGYLYEGESTASDPLSVGAFEIIRFDRVPSLNARDFENKAFL